MRALAFAAVIVVVAVASSCGGAASAGPPDLRLGTDLCDGCGMAIDEPRYAAAVLADDGGEPRVLKFDDIGCLARWEAGARSGSVRRRWVHDRSTGKWIDAATATFAQPGGLVTPMGSGLVAFEGPPDPAALAAEHVAATLSWSAVLARTRDGAPNAQTDSVHEDSP